MFIGYFYYHQRVGKTATRYYNCESKFVCLLRFPTLTSQSIIIQLCIHVARSTEKDTTFHRHHHRARLSRRNRFTHDLRHPDYIYPFSQPRGYFAGHTLNKTNKLYIYRCTTINVSQIASFPRRQTPLAVQWLDHKKYSSKYGALHRVSGWGAAETSHLWSGTTKKLLTYYRVCGEMIWDHRY